MRLTMVFAVLALLSGCAYHGDRTRAVPDRVHDRAWGEAEQGPAADHRELLLHAFGLIGIQYKYGGNSPDMGFDCSGLVQYVFAQASGVALPRTAHEMSKIGARIARYELQPGDLVFFNTLRRPFSHVGIYVGDQRFIHAPASGGRVEIVRMSNRYWQQRFNGARRIAFGHP
jgi:cell wall-associated NlpC family hydrolase